MFFFKAAFAKKKNKTKKLLLLTGIFQTDGQPSITKTKKCHFLEAHPCRENGWDFLEKTGEFIKDEFLSQTKGFSAKRFERIFASKQETTV